MACLPFCYYSIQYLTSNLLCTPKYTSAHVVQCWTNECWFESHPRLLCTNSSVPSLQRWLMSSSKSRVANRNTTQCISPVSIVCFDRFLWLTAIRDQCRYRDQRIPGRTLLTSPNLEANDTSWTCRFNVQHQPVCHWLISSSNVRLLWHGLLEPAVSYILPAWYMIQLHWY